MDKTPMRVLFDMDASKSYMSKSFYMANTGDHSLQNSLLPVKV